MTSATFNATRDGVWYFTIKAQDYAGNWSLIRQLTFIRDTTAPGMPWPLPLETDEDYFLESNDFTVQWQPPADEDVVGYSWNLERLGALEPSNSLLITSPSRTPQRTVTSPMSSGDVSSSLNERVDSTRDYQYLPKNEFERRLWVARSPAPIPLVIRGTRPAASFSNLENGYWAISVAAIDEVGNVGDAFRMMLRLNKYIPSTQISGIEQIRDDLDNVLLRIIGRGFQYDGSISRIAIDVDALPPYDMLFTESGNSYEVLSDRIITGISTRNLSAGTYRIGAFHERRGWHFSDPILRIDPSGTIKFRSQDKPWIPDWVFSSVPSGKMNPATLVTIILIVFPLVGILLALKQLASIVTEGMSLQSEAVALLKGKQMPDIQRIQKRLELKNRRSSLLVKFALTISLLAILIVFLVALPLGIQTTGYPVYSGYQAPLLLLILEILDPKATSAQYTGSTSRACWTKR